MNTADYVPLDLRALNKDVPLGCDLFIEKGGQYHLYRGSSSARALTRLDARRLVSSGVTHLWIRHKDGDLAAQQSLISLLELPDEHLPAAAKAQIWYSSAVSTAQKAIDSVLSQESLCNVDALMDMTVGYLAHSASAFPALLAATLHDHTLYAHSVNVAVYALGLGRYMGITQETELRNLGVAAFLHDVGKSKVAKGILHKPGPLNADEWAIMKQHPEWGRQMLTETADLPGDVVAAVSQHHERLDGSGYPKGASATEIHHFAMIVSLVDAYDAMTSVRPYSGPCSTYKALSILKVDTGQKYDPDLFASLVMLIGRPDRAGHA